jgi:hypothetical protein
MFKLTIKPKMKVVKLGGKLRVREVVRMYKDDVLSNTTKAVHHGPFLDRDEAARFMGQRALWWKGLANHQAVHGIDTPYPAFAFDENDRTSPFDALIAFSQPLPERMNDDDA